MRSHYFARHSVCMTDPQYQRREGRLLAAALEADGRSARAVAAEIGISDTRLRHIINGYQPMGSGQKIAVIGPPATVARAAKELGVTPEQLSDAGRVDAAQALRQMTPVEEFVEERIAMNQAALTELRAILDEYPSQNQVPDSALFLFSDLQLVDEIRRRLVKTNRMVSEMLQMERKTVDMSKRGGRDLSGPVGRTDDLIAAHDEDEPISGEQGESDTP